MGDSYDQLKSNISNEPARMAAIRANNKGEDDGVNPKTGAGLKFADVTSPQNVAQRSAAKNAKRLSFLKNNAPSRKDLVQTIKKRAQGSNNGR